MGERDSFAHQLKAAQDLAKRLEQDKDHLNSSTMFHQSTHIKMAEEVLL